MEDKLDLAKLAPAKQALIYEGWIARAHSREFPLEYPTGPEYRDVSELKAVVDQAPGIPVTLLHPPGLLRHGAVGKIVGRVQEAWLDNDHVVAKILVEDPEAWAAVDEGVYELSLGYQCQLDELRFQHNLSLDHLAIVPAGRCRTCELNPRRADHACDSGRLPLGAGTRFASDEPAATLDSVKVADLKVNLKLEIDEASRTILDSLINNGVLDSTAVDAEMNAAARNSRRQFKTASK